MQINQLQLKTENHLKLRESVVMFERGNNGRNAALGNDE